MIEPQSLINIVQDGLNDLIDSDKRYIKYHIKQSETSISLYIYKTLPQTGQLYILRVSDHLPLLQKMVRGTEAPRPSTDENANVSVDFYKPRREVKGNNETGKVEKKRIRNNFDNYVGVPANIPEVQPFTVSSYEYFYKNLEQSDELIIWHSIATWVCCLDPNKEFHDPFVTDENKKAKAETKTAEVHVFGDKIEIIENKTNKNMKNVQKISLNEAQLRNIIKESVKKVLNEVDWKTYASAADKRRKQAEGKPYEEYRKLIDKALKLDDAAGGALSRKFGVKLHTFSDNGVERNVFDDREWTTGTDAKGSVPLGFYYTSSPERNYPDGRYCNPQSVEDVDDFLQRHPEFMNIEDDEDFHDEEEYLHNKKEDEIGKEVDNYTHGNYEYIKGKGWQLKK